MKKRLKSLEKIKEQWKDYWNIILKSSIFTGMALFFWSYFIRGSFAKFPENEEVMSAVVAGFLVFSALLPTFTISKLSQQYDDLISAITDEDFKSFKRIYKRTIHPLVYLAIIVVSLLAIISLMMLPYERTIVGMFSVGGLSFVHCFFFYVAKELDNPNCWHLQIPSKWMLDLQEEKKKEGIK